MASGYHPGRVSCRVQALSDCRVFARGVTSAISLISPFSFLKSQLKMAQEKPISYEGALTSQVGHSCILTTFRKYFLHCVSSCITVIIHWSICLTRGQEYVSSSVFQTYCT